jgi:hypothetical protein
LPYIPTKSKRRGSGKLTYYTPDNCNFWLKLLINHSTRFSDPSRPKKAKKNRIGNTELLFAGQLELLVAAGDKPQHTFLDPMSQNYIKIPKLCGGLDNPLDQRGTNDVPDPFTTLGLM